MAWSDRSPRERPSVDLEDTRDLLTRRGRVQPFAHVAWLQPVSARLVGVDSVELITRVFVDARDLDVYTQIVHIKAKFLLGRIHVQSFRCMHVILF